MRIITNLAKKILPFSIRIIFRKLNWKIIYFKQVYLQGMRGDVYCPISEKKYKCFLKIRTYNQTPDNGAHSRHRLVWLFLKNKTKIFNENVSLLHIAPEFCFIKKFKSLKNLSYFPGDKMVEGYGKQDGVEYLDIMNMNFKDNSFDYILCNHVLEHVSDDKKAMKEIYRVLKKDGTAIITIPINEKLETTYEDSNITSPQEREKHFGQWDHVRWHGMDVKKTLETIGFKVEMIRYAEKFSAEENKKFGLCNDFIISAIKI